MKEATIQRKIQDAIRKAGGSVRITIYPDAGHDSWTQAYGNPALYRWFLKHRRKA